MEVSVNVSISMPPEMLEKIDENARAHGKSRAAYVRHLIQQAPDSPFETPELQLTDEPPAEA
ncbi:ribbon-helix-helix domain-containing protein [Haloferax volcanii]|uniref:Ribbon-helix-helix CopG family protein n=3 Tax=Haloferax volcanii TaxID=2246 RepID=A0A384LAR5_HALVD|nr:ribbon-helix-helix domain-containing protein [Haloferax volcanii]ADE04146.1 CopG domain protein [Haloferax volcanii DS2]ELY25052.1 ribbon-helix-helix CopG family protein [Haloferax volcanii DS2]MBS8119031.1 CopG family transcriptional regulator [Haloferax volcanii]MBS8124045.1 CopG family transcriptional regulator [Haloferax volcanii]MBS8127914.1 CopG family transcriptional regulator [Haloferax volcanii]